jgi:hypothetical protein
MHIQKLIAFAFILCFASVNAQKVDETKERAAQKSEQRLDQKIDKGIDSGLDAIEGLFSKKNKKKDDEKVEMEDDVQSQEGSSAEDKQTAAMMKMFGSSNVDVKDSYQFDHRFIILMEEFDKKGKLKESNEMTFLAKDDSPVMGLEIEQEGTATQLVYDLASYEMITLINTDGQKFGTTMSLDKAQVDAMVEESMDDTEATTTEMPQFRKTGKSKEISGYNCDEYEVTNMEGAEGEVIYWITEEADADWISSMSSMSGLNKQLPSMYAGTGYPEDGSVIQMIMTEDDGTSSVMTVKEIQKNQNVVINTKGYTFMNLPGGR